MSARRGARRWHFVALGVLGIVPLGFAVFLIVGGARSGSAYSGIASAIGMLVLAGLVGYALVSTAIVWFLAKSRTQVLLVHVAVLALVGAVSAFWV